MSPDSMATIVAVIGVGVALLAAILSGFAWTIRRTDAMFLTLQERIDAQSDRIDAQGWRLDTRLTAVEHELVELKVAVARLEGPERRLLAAR